MSTLSPIFKIPCLFLMTIAFQIAVTPPNPPPNPSEKVPSTRLEFILERRPGDFVKICCWVAFSIETTVILATRFPSSTGAPFIIHSLFFGGDPTRICLTPCFILGIFLTTFGGLIRFLCYQALGRLFTFEMSIRQDHRLIKEGPYSVVRHPSYTGVLCVVVGAICVHASPGSWLRESGVLQTVVGQGGVVLCLSFSAVVVFGLISRAPMEDRALRKAFGDEWDRWAERVPYRLIPWLY